MAILRVVTLAVVALMLTTSASAACEDKCPKIAGISQPLCTLKYMKTDKLPELHMCLPLCDKLGTKADVQFTVATEPCPEINLHMTDEEGCKNIQGGVYCGQNACVTGDATKFCNDWKDTLTNAFTDGASNIAVSSLALAVLAISTLAA